MVDHTLVNDTLVRDREGIVARCKCGWVSGGHFTRLGASSAMQDHAEECAKSRSTDLSGGQHG